MAAVFAHDVDHRWTGRFLVGGREKDNLFLYLHVGGPTDWTLGRLGTGLEMLGDRALLIESEGHEAVGDNLRARLGAVDGS